MEGNGKKKEKKKTGPKNTVHDADNVPPQIFTRVGVNKQVEQHIRDKCGASTVQMASKKCTFHGSEVQPKTFYSDVIVTPVDYWTKCTDMQDKYVEK